MIRAGTAEPTAAIEQVTAAAASGARGLQAFLVLALVGCGRAAPDNARDADGIDAGLAGPSGETGSGGHGSLPHGVGGDADAGSSAGSSAATGGRSGAGGTTGFAG